MAGPRALHSDPLGSHAHTPPPDPRRWNVLYQDKGLSPPGRGPAVCPRMSAQTPYASQERVCHPCSGWGPSWGRARQGPQQAALPGLRFLIPVGAGVSRCSRPLPAPPSPPTPHALAQPLAGGGEPGASDRHTCPPKPRRPQSLPWSSAFAQALKTPPARGGPRAGTVPVHLGGDSTQEGTLLPSWVPPPASCSPGSWSCWAPLSGPGE